MRPLFLCLIILTVAGDLKAQLDFEEYQNGYYITNDGNKIVGLIRYVKGNNARIEFKAKKDDKREKIYSKDCREFVLQDSVKFIRVSGSFSVKVGIGNISVSDDFIRVLDTGKVNLYMHYSISGDGNMNFPGTIDWENLVVRKDASDVYIGLHPNIKKRKKQIEDQLAGQDELIEILCRKKNSEVREGIRAYNSK